MEGKKEEELKTLETEIELAKGVGNIIVVVVNEPILRDELISPLKYKFKPLILDVDKLDGSESILEVIKREVAKGNLEGHELLIIYNLESTKPEIFGFLNWHREFFYSLPLPTVFFCTRAFADELVTKAADFWRYRSGVYEFKLEEIEALRVAQEVLSTSISYENKEELERRREIAESLVEKVEDKKMKADLLHKIGTFHQLLYEYNKAKQYYEESLEIFKELGDRKGEASSLRQLGMIYHDRGNHEEAERLYSESLEISKELGDKKGVANSLGLLGMIQQLKGNYEEAERLYSESLEIFKELGDKKGIAYSLHNLGSAHEERGNYEEAERLYSESLEISKELGDKKGVANSLGLLGMIQQLKGNYEEAERLYNESLKIFKELGDKDGIAVSFGHLGVLMYIQKRYEEAIQALSEAVPIFKELKSPYLEVTLRNIWEIERIRIQRNLEVEHGKREE